MWKEKSHGGIRYLNLPFFGDGTKDGATIFKSVTVIRIRNGQKEFVSQTILISTTFSNTKLDSEMKTLLLIQD